MSTPQTEELLRRLVVPLVGLYGSTSDRSMIDADMDRWAQVREVSAGSRRELLERLLVGFPEYRNLFYYRLDQAGRTGAARVARRIWRPMPLLEIACDSIGPGLVISHGHGTILTAERIGNNCWVHHQVTLGSDYRPGLPRIGDDVFIGVGAKILGPVQVGDRARIGANAVVVHNVPADATAVGVPAQMHRKRTG